MPTVSLATVISQADDDTYVVMENLRAFLAHYDASEPHYFGFRYKSYLVRTLRSLEREQHAGERLQWRGRWLRSITCSTQGSRHLHVCVNCRQLFSTQQFDTATSCPDDPYEDVGIGRCLAAMNIYPEKTSNARG